MDIVDVPFSDVFRTAVAYFNDEPTPEDQVCKIWARSEMEKFVESHEDHFVVLARHHSRSMVPHFFLVCSQVHNVPGLGPVVFPGPIENAKRILMKGSCVLRGLYRQGWTLEFLPIGETLKCFYDSLNKTRNLETWMSHYRIREGRIGLYLLRVKVEDRSLCNWLLPAR